MKTSIQITKERQAEFIKRLSDKAFDEVLAKIKDASDTGTFKMIISDDSMDRQGDMVDQMAFDTENYMKNPVVLWGHDYFSMPIGITDRIYRDGNKTIAEGRFAPTEEGQAMRKYYESGMPCAASIGFIPLEGENGKITKLELLEWSFVAIPANANCTSVLTARQHGFTDLQIKVLTTKGLIKAVDEGSPCEMEDGTPGVWAGKPGEDGAMVCIPEKDGKSMKKTNKEVDNNPDETNPSKDDLDTQIREDVKSEHEMHQTVTKAILEKCTKSIQEFKAGKGMVADELAEDDIQQQKWVKIERVYDVMWAFSDAYMAEGVAVEDFEKLFDEAMALMKDETAEKSFKVTKGKSIEEFKSHIEKCFAKCMKGMDTEHGRHAGVVNDSIDEYTEKMDAVMDPAEGKSLKTGATISAKTKEKLDKIHEHSKAIDEHTKAQRDVIEGMTSNDGGEGEKGEKPAPKQKSEDLDSKMTVEDYIKVQNILKTNLKSAVTLINEALRGTKNTEKRIVK